MRGARASHIAMFSSRPASAWTSLCCDRLDCKKVLRCCVPTNPLTPRILGFTKRRLDGQTPKSSRNQDRVHPGPLGETTGAWAPSYPGGVKRDRPAGEPPGRAIGGQIHKAGKKLPEGGLNLPWLVLICLVFKLVDCLLQFVHTFCTFGHVSHVLACFGIFWHFWHILANFGRED